MVAALARWYSRIAPTQRGTYRVARLARRFHPRDRWRGVFTTPDGVALELDLTIYPDCAMAFGLYETEMIHCIRRMLKPGDHFIDGGANLGYLTLLAAKCVGETGRVDAFEPHPDTFARLQANIARNGNPPQVHAHQLALADAGGELTIHTPADGNHGCASIYDEGPAVTVKAVRLDEHLAGTTPALIKLDLEGAEAIALDGATALLEAARPTLAIEHNPTTAGLAGRHWAEAIPSAALYRITAYGRRGRRVADIASLKQCNLLVELA